MAHDFLTHFVDAARAAFAEPASDSAAHVQAALARLVRTPESEPFPG